MHQRKSIKVLKNYQNMNWTIDTGILGKNCHHRQNYPLNHFDQQIQK